MKLMIDTVLQKSAQENSKVLLASLGILGNLSASQKMPAKELEKMYAAIEPLIDSDNEQVSAEVLRMISN